MNCVQYTLDKFSPYFPISDMEDFVLNLKEFNYPLDEFKNSEADFLFHSNELEMLQDALIRMVDAHLVGAYDGQFLCQFVNSYPIYKLQASAYASSRPRELCEVVVYKIEELFHRFDVGNRVLTNVMSTLINCYIGTSCDPTLPTWETEHPYKIRMLHSLMIRAIWVDMLCE